MSLAPLAEELLDYWFSGDDAECNSRWWGKSDATDTFIRERFGDHVVAASAGTFDSWTESPRGTLALVLLLDQVPRTIHRGSPKSWASDAKAREVVKAALAAGVDDALATRQEITFLYMPLMHSEVLGDQERSMQLFAALAERHPSAAGISGYAVKHHAIVARFGRFSHRNAILGRESTAEEVEFLRQPGSGF